MNMFSNRVLRAIGAKQNLESAACVECEPRGCFGKGVVRGRDAAFEPNRVTPRRRMVALVSGIALTLIFAVAAVPSKANETAESGTVKIALQNFPDTVSPGDKFEGDISVTLAPTKPQSRTQVQFQLFAVTPLGDALVNSGSFTLRTGLTKTVRIEQVVPDDIAPGKYSIALVVTANGQTLTVSHDFQVV